MDSEFYSVIDLLYVLESEALPNTSRPWSEAQAKKALSYLEKNGINEENKDLFLKAEQMLDAEALNWSLGDGFGFDATISLSPEVYYHENVEEFRSEESWIYRFDDRSKFLNLDLEFSFDDFFYTFCDLTYSVARYGEAGVVSYTPEEIKHGIGAIAGGMYSEFKQYKDIFLVKENERYSRAFSFNMPSKSKYFDFCWPNRAFISLSGEKWSLFFGRDRIKWGNSEVGNFILSDHIEYHDMARVQFFSDHFSYEWTNLFLDANVYGTEEDDPDTRLFMAHKLDFHLLNKLSFAFSENIMYITKNLDFGNLNPGFIFHNLNKSRIFNAIAHAELNFTPIRGLLLYGQFVLDQATAPNEAEDQSPSFGYSIGAKYSHKLGEGYLTEGAEYIYTSPLLYRRDAVDFIVFHKDNVFYAWNAIRPYYLGFIYGGDVRLVNFNIKYEIPSVLTSKLYVEYMQKGSINMLTSHNASGNNEDKPFIEDNKSPSGEIINEYLTVSLSAEYQLPQIVSFADLSMKGSISYIHAGSREKSTNAISNARDDVQISFGIDLVF